jgi:hypothetical protein
MQRLEQQVYDLWSSVGVDGRSTGIMREELAPLKERLPGMYTHSLRLTVYCGALSVDDHRSLRRLKVMGASMHDIGKAMLPHELFRNGPLNPEEWALMQTHPLNGFLALRDRLPLTAGIAGMHHYTGPDGYGVTMADMPFEPPEFVRGLLTTANQLVARVDFCDSWYSRKDGKFGDRSDAALAKALGERFRLNDAHLFVESVNAIRKEYF